MSWKDRAKKVSADEWRARARSTSVASPTEDDGPDVSGLNDKPARGVMDTIAEALSPETALGAVAHKLPQGLSYKLSDELQGGMEAATEGSKALREGIGLDEPAIIEADPLTGEADRAGLMKRLLDAYKRGTRAERDDLAISQAAQPALSTGSELVGAMAAPAPLVGKMAKGTSALKRALAYGKSGAAVGAGFGFGGSEGETPTEVLKDTAKGAGIGGAGGAVLGGLLHKPLSRLEGAERAAVERAYMEAQKKAEKAVASARGSLGGKTQVGSRQTESLQNALNDPSIPRAMRDEVLSLMADPKWGELRKGVIEGQLESAPSQLAIVQAARAEMEAAKRGAMPDAVQNAADSMLSREEAMAQVLRRLKTYASRAVPPIIGGAIGSGVGGVEGAALGGLMGFGASAALGAPGTALANMLRHPAVASRLAAATEYPARAQAVQKPAMDALMEDEQMKALVERLRSR